MESIEETRLNWTLYDLFLFLSNAVMCIPDKYQQQVFNDMAYKLIEWCDTPRSELRTVFDKFSMEFEELCIHCNEEMSGWRQENEDEPDPVCDACKAEKESDEDDED
jgi:hypothetical protein